MRFIVDLRPDSKGYLAAVIRILARRAASFFEWMVRSTKHSRLRPLALLLNELAYELVVSRARVISDTTNAKESLQGYARRALSHVSGDRRGPKVLVVSQRAWATHSALEAIIAAALTLRGASVSLFTCGRGLPICEMGRPGDPSSWLCRSCSRFQEELLGVLDLPRYTMGALVSEDARQMAEKAAAGAAEPDLFSYCGMPIGRLARISVAWWLKDPRVAGHGRDASIHQEFLGSGAIMAIAAAKVLDELQPDIVFALNGAFLEERIICEAARSRGMRVVTYEGGNTPDTWFFTASANPACEYNIDDLWTEAAPGLAEQDDAELTKQLSERETGVHAGGISGFRMATGTDLLSDLRVSEKDRLMTIFTNVDWDTGALERGEVFKDQLDFVCSALEYALEAGDLKIAVRVHPAEALFPPRSSLPKRLAYFAAKTDRLKIIAPDDPSSSYALFRASDLNLVWTSTIGLEAAAAGCPVIVGGRTHYSGKGFTWDVSEREQLREWICRSRPQMSDERLALARKYAHLFFCRSFIPLPLLDAADTSIKFNFHSPEALERKKDPFLDLICDGIITGSPFVLPSRLEETKF